MAKVSRTRGSASNIFDVFIQDSSSTTGAGLGSVTSGSSGLTILSKRELDADWTSLTPQTITTIGTYAAPSAASIRIKASGASAPTGSYQLMVLDALLGTGDASRWAQISIAGVTNMAPLILEIDLDPQVDVKFWNGTAVSSPATAGIPEVNVKNINNVSTSSVTTINANQGTTGVVTFTVAAQVDCNVKDWAGTAVSAPSTAGIPEVNVKNVNNVSTSAVTTVKAVQGLAVDGVVTTVTNQLTAAQVATGVWQDTTAGDFTTALSVGKSVMNGVSLGTGLKIAECVLTDTLTTYTGNTPQTGDAFARIGAAGVGLSAIPDEAGVTTLLARLTALRAGYLDNLSAGAVALASGVIVTTNNDKTGYALSTAGQQAIADAWSARNVAGGSSSGRTNGQAIQTLRNKQAIVAGVYTCYATDDTTPLFEANVTTAAGNPMSAWAPTT